MDSQLYWLVPDKVLYWKLSSVISAEEISEMSRLIITTGSNLSVSRIHLMIDATGLKNLDSNDQQARADFAKLATQRWMGQVVAIVHNLQLQMQLNAMSSAFGMKWKTVPSLKQASRSLKQSDNSLPSNSDLKSAIPVDSRKPDISKPAEPRVQGNTNFDRGER